MSSVLNISYAEICDQNILKKSMKEVIFKLLFLKMNSFTDIFSKIFSTDSDAKYKQQLFLRTAIFRTRFTSEHFLKTRDLLSKLIVKTFLYFKIRLDPSLLDHLLHEAAALVKSMTYGVLFKASSHSIKILALAAQCICWF